MIELKCAWLDNQAEVINSSLPRIESIFKEEFDILLKCSPYYDAVSFMGSYKDLNCKVDFIFLDIDLKDPLESGISVYNEIRKNDQKTVIVFVSGNMNNSTEWGSRVIELKEIDNYYLLGVQIPINSNLM
jgi:DNA-binding LytR/AlgR family response regulator